MSEENEEQMIPTPSDFGHFVLEKELGHGGMGGVYLARDKMLDRKVAIKVMLKSLGADSAFVERFQREAQAAARLNHPNIAQIYSFGQENGMPYIAMELVSGGSLDKEMEATPGAMDPVRVMKVGQQVADALALAAEQDLVHGDVKPENVLFDADGNAKLVDFGLAAMQGDSSEIWGTPYYISPEKVRRQKIDYRADIYSLGGTLYHALTGVAPFEGEDATAVVKARFNGPPRKPSEVRPDLPPEIDAIIMRMLELEPAMRYPTYQSLLGDFKRFLSKAGPVKTQKLGGPRVKIKGAKIKLNLSAEETGKVAAEGGAEPEAAAEEEADEAKPLNVGKIVLLVVAGILLLLGGTGGGLWWYVASEKAAAAKAERDNLLGNLAKARASVQNTLTMAEAFAEKFHGDVEACDKDFARQMREIRSSLTGEMKAPAAALLDLAPTKDIAEAVAYTNQLFAAAAAPADANAATNAVAAAGTNAVAQAAGGTNAVAAVQKGAPAKAEPAKKAEQKKPEPQKKAEPAGKPDGEAADGKAEEAAPEQELPRGLKEVAGLWGKVCAYRAADIRVQGGIRRLLEKGRRGLETLTGEDADTLRQLVELAEALVKEFDEIRNAKSVEQARFRMKDVRARGQTLPATIGRQVKVIVDRAARAAKKKAEMEAKAAAAAKAAEARKAQVEAETKAAQEKFDELVGSRLKYLDWKRAQDQLRKLLDEGTKTIEGKEAVRAQMRKVTYMEEMQKQLIRGLAKYVKEAAEARGDAHAEHRLFRFRHGEHRGSVVTAVDDKSLTLVPLRSAGGRMTLDAKAGRKVDWTRFYGKEEFVGCMSDLINALVLKGRDTVGTSKVAGARQMLGSALTLQLLYSDVKGADAFVPVLVKQAVKDDEDAAKWAKMWFPDVSVEEE